MMSQKFSQRSGFENDLDSGSHPGLAASSARSGSFRVPGGRPEFQKGVESVASMGSNLAHHAKSLVGSFACATNNERTGQAINGDLATEAWRGRRSAAAARAETEGGSGNVGITTGSQSYRESAAVATNSQARQVDI